MGYHRVSRLPIALEHRGDRHGPSHRGGQEADYREAARPGLRHPQLSPLLPSHLRSATTCLCPGYASPDSRVITSLPRPYSSYCLLKALGLWGKGSSDKDLRPHPLTDPVSWVSPALQRPQFLCSRKQADRGTMRSQGVLRALPAMRAE